MKIAIINWTGDRKNWGCQATSYGLLADIRDACAPEAVIDPEMVSLGSKSAGDRLVRRFFLDPLRRHLAREFSTPRQEKLFYLLNWLIYKGKIDLVKKADAVFFMAEGTMDGTTFFGGERLVMLPYLAATSLGKRVISLNQTLYSETDSFVPILENVYRRFSLVAVREPASLDLARRLNPENAMLFPDSAFRTEPSATPPRQLLDTKPSKPLLAVTASAQYDHAHRGKYLRSLCEYARDRELQVCGLFWKPRWIAALSDAAEASGGLQPVFPKSGCDCRDISAILADCVAFIGGRYHSIIQAATVKTPFVPLPTNSHKTEGLLDLLEWPLSIRAFDDFTGMTADLDNVLSNRERYAKHLQRVLKKVAEIRQDGIDLLASKMSFTGSERVSSR